jgi:hypothetical protein
MRTTLLYSAQRKPTFIYRTRDSKSSGVRAQLYLARLPIRAAGNGGPLFHLEGIVYTECDDLGPESKQTTPIDQRARDQLPGAVPVHRIG